MYTARSSNNHLAVHSLLIGDSCINTAASLNFGISQIHNTFGILSRVQHTNTSMSYTEQCLVLVIKAHVQCENSKLKIQIYRVAQLK